MRAPDFAALEEREVMPCDIALPGMAAQLMDARIEGRVASRRCIDRQCAGGDRERRDVERRNPEQETGRSARRDGGAGHSSQKPQNDRSRRIGHDEPHHVARASSERHAHADLTRPLRHRVRRDRVDPARRQEQRSDGEAREQPGAELARRDRAVDERLQRPRPRDGNLRIDDAHLATDQVGQRRSAAPDHEVDARGHETEHLLRHLRHRDVHRGGGRLVQIVVLHLPCHADDLDFPRSGNVVLQPQVRTERRPIGEEAALQFFVYDHHTR